VFVRPSSLERFIYLGANKSLGGLFWGCGMIIKQLLTGGVINVYCDWKDGSDYACLKATRVSSTRISRFRCRLR